MPAEVFDEERRAWIAARAGIWLFQKRRAEMLGKRIRARSRAKVGARPDPHDDQVSAPLVFRPSSTPTGSLETVVVAASAVAAPIGWPLGRILYMAVVRLVPERLQSYPIVALTWSAVLSGAPLPLLYNPSPSLASALIIPLLLAQVPATFAAAAAYGVLEGWLAIDGSSDWWPLAPAQRSVDDNLILGPDPLPMPTLLDPAGASAQPEAAPRVPRRRPAPINWVRLAIPAVIMTAGALWFAVAVLGGVMAYPAELLAS